MSYQKSSIMDAAARMRNGLFLYPMIWLLMTQVEGYASAHLYFFAINLFVLAGLSLSRFALHRRLAALLDHDFSRTRLVFRSASVLYNLYWGVLTGIIMTETGYPALQTMALAATVGITAGGTVIVAIDSVLAMLYPCATLGPMVVLLAPIGGSFNIAICSLVAVFLVYSATITRVVGRDYWARQCAQAMLEQRAIELEAISRTDALTQLANRLHFEERVAQVWREANRLGQPVCVAMVDLDHFKQVNDKFGHPFGDRCLQAAAQALSTAVHRPSDLVARYGGEEFVILMPDTGIEGTRCVAARILAQINNTHVEEVSAATRLSCSIGIAALETVQDHTPANLVKIADAALYQAKQSGRGRVVEYRPTGQSAPLRTVSLATFLSRGS